MFVTLLVWPSDLAPEAHRLAAVFGLVVVLWVTEAVPLAVAALVGPALAVVLGVTGPREAFAPFAHPIIFLFLGSFLLSMGMTTHGLDRRLALFVLSRRWVGESPRRILLAFGAIGWALSMWMSNTATTAMMLPIGLGVLRTVQAADDVENSRAPYATALMLMIAYSCSIGGIATPVGTPPNLIAIGLIESILGRSITFFEWMSFALPISAVLFVGLYLVIRRVFRVGGQRLAGASETIAAERGTLGPTSAGEKAALMAFLTAVTLWILPGAAGLVLGADDALTTTLERVFPEAVVAILAAALLFAFPIDWKRRRFALDWKQATNIDWGTILLFGGGLSLGTMAFDSGLAAALGQRIETVASGVPGWAVVLLAVLAADVMTEFMSNTATANLLIPIFLALAIPVGDSDLLTALAATLGCSLAFCLPVATPPNAIVYGSGRIALPQMIRVGIWLDLGAALVVWLGLLLSGAFVAL